jgi:uncharacterized membrane protein
MLDKKTTSKRLAAFSDGVFAVIITITVLDLKPPAEPTLQALALLWPLMLSYAISYLFIAIIWVNHHHLLGFAHVATAELIWWNFAHLFMVSLVPVTTAWMAATRLATTPVFIYALVFVLVEIAYIAFERTAFSQATESEITPRLMRIARLRSYVALIVFTVGDCHLVLVASERTHSGLLCLADLPEPTFA